MSYWKKIITLFLVILMVIPWTLPPLAFADMVGASSGVSSTSCPPGQQPDASGQNCVAIPVSNHTVTTPTSSDPCINFSGSAYTQCQNAAAANPTLKQFQPNVNISSGNTYGGSSNNSISISGVGGAIASCTNVGSFLISGAINLLSQTAIGKKVSSLFGFVGGGSVVPTSDKKAQDQIANQTKISQCLDGVAYAVAKNTLAQVTNKTLNWVNTGLNGNPLYVQNTTSYLNSIKNQQTTAFLGAVQSSDPIFGNALRSAITLQITGKSDGLLNTPLNTPQAQNYNSFLSDFTNGGWNALLNPSYNPIGAFFNASDSLTNQITSSQQSAANEIQRGNGFLDLKHCTQYAPAPTGSDTSAVAQAALSGTQTCTQWATDTPGSIIANQVATITTTPTRQLEYANKINEVLGSFFDSFVNNLLSKGLRGSGPSTRVDFGLSAGGDNTVVDTASSNSSTSALGYQSASTGGVTTGDFDISHPQQLRAILQTQYDFLNRTQDAQIALDRIIPTIGALDYCIPGPNPDWQTGLDSNWQTFSGSIQQANPKDQSTVEKLVASIPIVGGFFDSLVSIFTGSGTAPALWSGSGVLADKVTGSNVQINRTFYAPKGHKTADTTTNNLENALNTSYQTLITQYNYYNTKGSTFVGSNVGNAFEQAAVNDPDPLYVDGFLQDAYTETDSITGYNQAVTTIDQQYTQNISDTQNDIKQLEDIRKQVNSIVATAKARYIKQRADAGDPVNMQCIDQAYQIDNSSITPVARQEPQNTALSNEEDAMVQHATDSANYFYNNQIK